MAVELRCPDCRAKLRLKTAPEAGTEVECPKCGTVFPAPEPELEADEDAPKKKQKAEEEESEEKPDEKNGQKGKKKGKKGAKNKDPNVPRKRKAKKRETSKVALIAVVVTGLLMLFSVGGGLVWFFTRTSKSVEMMYYLPDDAQQALGVNVGHTQKYPEIYKSIKSSQDNNDYRQIGDVVAKACGADFDSLVDYVVKGEHLVRIDPPKEGDPPRYTVDCWSIVYRTKDIFDESGLAKIPGAEKKALDGHTYYTASIANQRLRVFAPTNRLIVVYPDGVKEGTFRKILNGNIENRENTLGKRMGSLGQRTTKGTFWQMAVYDSQLKPPVLPPAVPGASQNDEEAFQRTVVDALNGAKGYGVKASLGSREVRFEMIVWHPDSDKSSNFAKKMKESDLGKGDEGTPPRWFTNKTQSLGDRKVGAQMLSNIGFGSSGDLFYAKSAVETVDLKTYVGPVVNKVTGMEKRQEMAMPGAPGGPGKVPRRRKYGRGPKRMPTLARVRW